jgi:hypothetical protein
MAQCTQTFILVRDGKQETIPCGKCINCKKRRISAWSFRLVEEDKISSSSSFITLTYDSINVPLTEKGYMNLCKRDLQLFFKRLRKRNKNKIKYYACGEYGGKTDRPHYHIILFNADIETIQESWGKGQVHYGKVSEASVGYTLKYICKESKIPKHKNDDRQKEFPLMSKGMGKNYLSNQMINWHKADLSERMYCNLKDGKKITMPRYYKEKMYTEEEKQHIKQKSIEKIQKQELEIWKNIKTPQEQALRISLKKQRIIKNIEILKNEEKNRNKI